MVAESKIVKHLSLQAFLHLLKLFKCLKIWEFLSVTRFSRTRVDKCKGVLGRDSMGGGHSLIFFRRMFTFKSQDVNTHMRSRYKVLKFPNMFRISDAGGGGTSSQNREIWPSKRPNGNPGLIVYETVLLHSVAPHNGEPRIQLLLFLAGFVFQYHANRALVEAS